MGPIFVNYSFYAKDMHFVLFGLFYWLTESLTCSIYGSYFYLACKENVGVGINSLMSISDG